MIKIDRLLLIVVILGLGLCPVFSMDNLNSSANAAEDLVELTKHLPNARVDEPKSKAVSATTPENNITSNPNESIVSDPLTGTGKKKLLYINSYHKGYVWSDGIENGLFKALGINENKDGSLGTKDALVELKILRMDTKNNKSEEFIAQAVLDARTIIREWQPDVVVASDDNVSRYLISKYYIGSSIPFVFCAVNADPASYGFGSNNVTGMIEKDFFKEVIDLLKPFAKGSRVGYIGFNTRIGKNIVRTIIKDQKVVFTDGKLVSTFSEWKDVYKELQNSVDMILWLSPTGIEGWNEQEAIEFVNLHTKVPSGSTINSSIPCALIGQMKLAEEQGWWAGKTALKILTGVSPADIPIVGNEQSRLYLNMGLAKALGIIFPMELIEKSTFVDEEKE